MTKSRFNKINLIIIPAVFVIVGVVLITNVESQSKQTNFKEEMVEVTANTYTPTSYRKVAYEPVEIDEVAFTKSIAVAEGRESKKIKNLHGGIVTHHDLVSDLMADFFLQIKNNSNPKTFIIIGPNHFGQALAPGISGQVNWQTSFGALEHDYEILDELEQKRYLAYDEYNLVPDHTVKVLTSHIKYHFPEAKIVPILLSPKYGLKESYELAQELSEYVKDPDVMLIGSIDFSHYLPSSVAEEMDKITLEAIKQRDYKTISEFNDDNVDSPLALIITLRVMEILGANDMEILQNTNSGKYFGQEVEESTSYFTILFGS